jgi:hypothetical protein
MFALRQPVREEPCFTPQTVHELKKPVLTIGTPPRQPMTGNLQKKQI